MLSVVFFNSEMQTFCHFLACSFFVFVVLKLETCLTRTFNYMQHGSTNQKD